MRKITTSKLRITFGLCFAAAAAMLLCQRASALDLPYGYSSQTELRKPATGERQRLHIFNEKKEKVAVHIFYLDNKVEYQQLDSKGKVKNKRLADSRGKTLSRYEYCPEGKLLREWEADTLVYLRRKLSDGTWESVRYKPDGKRAQVLRRTR